MSSYIRRWFVGEVNGILEVKEFECQHIPEHHGYIVKAGCFRDFVPDDKVYETEEEAMLIRFPPIIQNRII
jgi:hypothetical protein